MRITCSCVTLPGIGARSIGDSFLVPTRLGKFGVLDLSDTMESGLKKSVRALRSSMIVLK